MSTSKIFRISGLPLEIDIDTLREALRLKQEGIDIKATISPCCSDPGTKVAIVEFKPCAPSYLKDVISGARPDHQIEMNDDHDDLNIDMDFYGLTQLYATPHKADITADIVAVTGIAGHAFGSWRGKGNLRRMWLQDFLKKDLPRCRTMIFGYDSRLDSPGAHEMQDYRDNLLTELKKARTSDQEQNRPIIFIGHSFGGIVITQALVKSRDSNPASDPDTYAIYRATYATLFFGTPHRGFNVKSLTKMVDRRKSEERLSLLNSIGTDSPLLEEGLKRFLTFAHQLKVVSFYEMLKSKTPEQVTTGFERIGPYELSVPKESALLGLDPEIEKTVGVNKDHTQLVKFDTKQCSAYSDTIAHLKVYQKNLSLPDTGFLSRSSTNTNSHYSQDTTGNFIAAYEAIERSDVDQLVILCDSNKINSENVNLRHDDGSTLLHIAMSTRDTSKRLKMIQSLLEKGADLMARNENRVTPLVQAAMSEQKKGVLKLLPPWLPVKDLGRDRRGWSQLHVAAAYGNANAVKILVQLGVDIEARNNDLSTPLHEAIRAGNKPTTTVLISLGANIQAKDRNGTTALDLAALEGKVELVEVLLVNKADVTVTDIEKWTPLHSAASRGHEPIVTVLLSHKASIDARDSQGQTPIYQTIKNGHRDLSSHLLLKGANWSVSDSHGRTVLHYAAMAGDGHVAKMLLEKGVDVMAADETGKTALHCAVKSGHSGVGRVLLDLGKADVTSVDNKKRTPLHHAAGNGHSDSVEMLLRHNAPMEARDIHGSTPLLYAANSGHESTVTILVNESADINAIDDQGCSALHLAAKQGHLQVLIQLVHEGVNVDATNVKGKTALQLASDEDNDNIVSELKKEGGSRKNVKHNVEEEEVKVEKVERNRILEHSHSGKASADGAGKKAEGVPSSVFYLLIPVLMAVTFFTVR